MQREKTMYWSVLVLEFMGWNFNQLALIYIQYWYISNIRNQINFESVKAALMMKNSFAGGKMLHLFSFYQEIQDSVAMALRNDKRYNFAYKIEITWDAYDQGPNKGAISWQAARVFLSKTGSSSRKLYHLYFEESYEVSDYIEHSWNIPKLFITQVHQKPLGTPMIGGHKVWNRLVPIWIISVYEYKRLPSEVYVNFRIGLNFCGQFNFFFN